MGVGSAGTSHRLKLDQGFCKQQRDGPASPCHQDRNVIGVGSLGKRDPLAQDRFPETIGDESKGHNVTAYHPFTVLLDAPCADVVESRPCRDHPRNIEEEEPGAV